jgi:hypothetical protein
MTTRTFFQLLIALTFVFNVSAQNVSKPVETKQDEKITGSTQAGYDLKWLEQEIEKLRKNALVPGLAVGIVYKDELIFAKGFGV